MASILGSIIRNATRSENDRLNVLSFPTHESYQSSLSNTNAEYFLYRGEGIKDWSFQYRQLPRNHHLLDPNKGEDQLPFDINFDCVLSQNVAGQYPVAKKIARSLHLPLVCITHVLPPPNVDKNYLEQVKQLRGDINIFISEYSRDKWGWGPDEAEVIHHGVDTNLFKPNERRKKERVILSVNNDFINRNWCLNYDGWKKITKGLPVKIVGDTPGLSDAAKSTTELISFYQTAQVFLNTSTVSPIPSVVLEAMACGLPIVSTSNCMLPSIIEHGKSGFLSNDEKALRLYCQQLLDDPNLAKKMGERGRQIILERFNLDRFTKNWDNILLKASSLVFKGE